MSFNRVIVIGNLGRDPELRYTPQGDAVCSFTVATNEKRKISGEMEDVTTWFKVTLWGKKAEAASQYLTKGRPVYIEGRLRVEEWVDRDGKQRFTLEVNANEMQFLGGKQDDDQAPRGRAAAASGGAAPLSSENDGSDDDIPF